MTSSGPRRPVLLDAALASSEVAFPLGQRVEIFSVTMKLCTYRRRWYAVKQYERWAMIERWRWWSQAFPPLKKWSCPRERSQEKREKYDTGYGQMKMGARDLPAFRDVFVEDDDDGTTIFIAYCNGISHNKRPHLDRITTPPWLVWHPTATF